MNESERDIHSIGGLAAFGTYDFPSDYAYIALGHIHKPQQLASHIRYSGSPIPLSFSERNNPNFILEINLTDDHQLTIDAINVPRARDLKAFKGTLKEVEEKLAQYQTNYTLPTLLEVHVEEEVYDPEVNYQFDQMLLRFNNSTQSFKIIKPKLTFLNRRTEADELYQQGTQIADLTERDVFTRLLEQEEIPDETKQLLQEAFNQLLNELPQ
jgi:exonuclease SbcD